MNVVFSRFVLSLLDWFSIFTLLYDTRPKEADNKKVGVGKKDNKLPKRDDRSALKINVLNPGFLAWSVTKIKRR